MRPDRERIDNRLAILEKRMDWLARRFEGRAPDECSYDRQEHAALKWAIPLLKGMIEGEREETECYCNSLRHRRSRHPVSGCIVDGCCGK